MPHTVLGPRSQTREPKVTEPPLWGKAVHQQALTSAVPVSHVRQCPCPERALGCPGRGGHAQRAPRPVLVGSGCRSGGRQTGGLQTAETPSCGRLQTCCQVRARLSAQHPSLCPQWRRARELPGVSCMRSLTAWRGLHPHETASPPEGPASSFQPWDPQKHGSRKGSQAGGWSRNVDPRTRSPRGPGRSGRPVQELGTILYPWETLKNFKKEEATLT